MCCSRQHSPGREFRRPASQPRNLGRPQWRFFLVVLPHVKGSSGCHDIHKISASLFCHARLPAPAVAGSPSYMVGSIHEEQFIANPRRRTSAHAQRSKCGALSFRASAKIDFRNGRGSVYTPLREKCMTRREGEAPAEPTNSMGAKRIFHGSAEPRPPHEPSGRRISVSSCVRQRQGCSSLSGHFRDSPMP